MATKKSTPDQARAEQHPAVAGHPDVEVEERSADGSDSLRHVKTIVVAGDQVGREDGPGHDANKGAVAQEAIQRGLHPRGEVRLEGSEALPDGVSRALTYSVDVVPSSTDTQPGETTTPRSVTQREA